MSNLFFSKSAPAGSSGRERRPSVTSLTHGTGYHLQEAYSPSDPVLLASGPSSPKSTAGHYVTVLDLAVLLNAPSSKPIVVAEFIALKNQRISHLQFSDDGNALIVSPKDGQVMRVFHIKPASSVSRHVSNTPSAGVKEADSTCNMSQPWHIYNLRRGRTSAVVEGVSVSEDGMWTAVGTRKRTVHVFAVNPYGGKPDQKSHLENRVRNVTELVSLHLPKYFLLVLPIYPPITKQQPLSTEVLPIVRLRTVKPALEQSLAPVNFIFLKSCESSLPANLLPPATVSLSVPTSVHSSPIRHPETLSPRRMQRPTNYQDVLLFDPIEGILSLRRLTLEIRTCDQGLSFPTAVHNLGATSVSLPGASPLSRLGVSPSSGGRPSGLSQMMNAPAELVGRDSTVASWNLRRGQDWGEIRHVFREVFLQASARSK